MYFSLLDQSSVPFYNGKKQRRERMMEDILQRIKETEAYCWKCRTPLSREDLMVVDEGETTIAELCYSCYEETMMN